MIDEVMMDDRDMGAKNNCWMDEWKGKWAMDGWIIGG